MTPSTPTQSVIRIHSKLFKLLGQRMAHTHYQKHNLLEWVNKHDDGFGSVGAHPHLTRETNQKPTNEKEILLYKKPQGVYKKRAAGRGKCNALVSTEKEEKMVKRGRQVNSQSPKKKKDRKKKGHSTQSIFPKWAINTENDQRQKEIKMHF